MAAATQERRLLGVGSTARLGAVYWQGRWHDAPNPTAWTNVAHVRLTHVLQVNGRVPQPVDPVHHGDLHGTSPTTQTTGGLSASVSDQMPVKPATVRRAAISRPAATVVSAVAPGHRGWETIAIRPPVRMRRWSSLSRASGSRHMPMLFTAKTLSNGSASAGRDSAAPRRRATRPARTASRLRLVACRTMTAE